MPIGRETELWRLSIFFEFCYFFLEFLAFRDWSWHGQLYNIKMKLVSSLMTKPWTQGSYVDESDHGDPSGLNSNYNTPPAAAMSYQSRQGPYALVRRQQPHQNTKPHQIETTPNIASVSSAPCIGDRKIIPSSTAAGSTTMGSPIALGSTIAYAYNKLRSVKVEIPQNNKACSFQPFYESHF